MEIIRSVRWSEDGDAVRIIDQRVLPERFIERDLRTLADVTDAIRTLAVRGAPAIGIAGAMGLVVSLRTSIFSSRAELLSAARENADAIRATRPTAVNLPWALDRMLACGERAGDDVEHILRALHAEADEILDEDRAMCRRIGEHGLELLPPGARVLTHCNAGALATGGIGTALAPIYLATERGQRIEVYANETRPLLQGSRLTAWELSRAGIPVTVLADHMAATLMHAGKIDLCLVGADRIAANGDTANKIGTYALAIAARYHDIPFYVAAPTSTFDLGTATGADIHIEERNVEEIRRGFGSLTAPMEAGVFNPAFDVTPAELITAIVSDRGVHRAPFAFSAHDRAPSGETSTSFP